MIYVFNEKQMNLVHNRKLDGYEIVESKLEGRVKVYASKDDHAVLLFVLTQDESKQNFKNQLLKGGK